MPLQTITLSSANVPGVSAAAVTNWRSAEPMSVSILTSTTATATGGVVLQFTLDDLMLVGGSSNAFWQGVSSAIGQPAQIFSIATAPVDGIYFVFPSPVAAVRMNSTALSSGPLVMKVIQGEGG